MHDDDNPAASGREPAGRRPESRRGGLGAPTLILFGGLGTVGVIGIVLVVVFAIIGLGATVADSGAGASPTPSAKPAATPSSAVAGYLNAIAEADAKAALSYLADPPAESSTITDEILQASQELAPITDIEVAETVRYTAEVGASYKMGGQLVTTVVKVDSLGDIPLIRHGYAELDLGLIGRGGLPLTINGVEVENDIVQLLPGTYEFGTTVEYITLGSGAGLTVYPHDIFPTMRLSPELNRKGQATFKKLVRTSIDTCVKSKRLDGGCGLNLPERTSDGYTLEEGTVTRTLDKLAREHVKNLQPELDVGQTTVAFARTFSGIVTTRVDVKKKGRTVRQTDVTFGAGTSFGTPSVDLSAKKLKVSWD